MVFTNIQPFPHVMSPLSNVTPFTYRDGNTFQEKLELMRVWLNESLVPDTDAALANAIDEFQTGLTNAEQTVLTAKAGWKAQFDALEAEMEADFASFTASVNENMTASFQDIEATKTAWNTRWNAFMADVEAEIAALNDSAVGGLVNNTASVTGSAVKTQVDLGAIQQIDYVREIARISPYSKMTVERVNSANELRIVCKNADGTKWVRHTVTPSTFYQYVGVVDATGTAAPGTYGASSEKWTDQATLGGTWNTASTPYTTTVGSTWSVTGIVTTTANALVDVTSYVDNRGGLWQPTVDGVDVGTPYSVYAAVGALKTFTAAITIADAGTHTVGARYLGADPANAPSGGTARGWFHSATAADPKVFFTVRELGGVVIDQLTPTSNKDFAFSIKPTTGGAYEFVPYHGTASEAFASPTKYYVGGKEVTMADFPRGVPVDVVNFEIVQHIYGRNSFTGTTNLIEVWTTQTISPNGIYSVNGRWKPIVDVIANDAVYPVMIMGSLTNFDRVISSLKHNENLAQSNGAALNKWIPGGDKADSWAYISSTKDHVAAMRFNNRRETLRVGQKNPATTSTFLEFRAGGTMAKLYSRAFDAGTTVTAGTVNRWSGDYFYGSVPGIGKTLALD